VKFARRTRAEVEVNLTPLIDVVFLLLIFFMVSTTFTKETQISIDLPEASADPTRIAEKQIEISITSTGKFAINEVALLKSNLENLKSAIEKVSGGDNTIPMIITADASTPHQSVVTAMDAAGQLGFVKLSITTKNSTEKDSL
jgi:biopolymer transport protein ExbD